MGVGIWLLEGGEWESGLRMWAENGNRGSMAPS